MSNLFVNTPVHQQKSEEQSSVGKIEGVSAAPPVFQLSATGNPPPPKDTSTDDVNSSVMSDEDEAHIKNEKYEDPAIQKMNNLQSKNGGLQGIDLQALNAEGRDSYIKYSEFFIEAIEKFKEGNYFDSFVLMTKVEYWYNQISINVQIGTAEKQIKKFKKRMSDVIHKFPFDEVKELEKNVNISIANYAKLAKSGETDFENIINEINANIDIAQQEGARIFLEDPGGYMQKMQASMQLGFFEGLSTGLASAADGIFNTISALGKSDIRMDLAGEVTSGFGEIREEAFGKTYEENAGFERTIGKGVGETLFALGTMKGPGGAPGSLASKAGAAKNVLDGVGAVVGVADKIDNKLKAGEDLSDILSDPETILAAVGAVAGAVGSLKSGSEFLKSPIAKNDIFEKISKIANDLSLPLDGVQVGMSAAIIHNTWMDQTLTDEQKAEVIANQLNSMITSAVSMKGDLTSQKDPNISTTPDAEPRRLTEGDITPASDTQGLPSETSTPDSDTPRLTDGTTLDDSGTTASHDTSTDKPVDDNASYPDDTNTSDSDTPGLTSDPSTTDSDSLGLPSGTTRPGADTPGGTADGPVYGPVHEPNHDTDIIRRTDDMKKLREDVDAGDHGDPEKARERMQIARVKIVQDVKAKVKKQMESSHPDVEISYKEPGTPKFTSDIDVSVMAKHKKRVMAEKLAQRGKLSAEEAKKALSEFGISETDPRYAQLHELIISGSLTHNNAHQFLSEAEIRQEMAASVDGSIECSSSLGNSDKSLDTNFYTDLRVDDLTSRASEKDKQQNISLQTSVSLAELQRTMTPEEWSAHKQILTEKLELAGASEQTIARHNEQIQKAEGITAELDTMTLDGARQQLKELLENPDASYGEIMEASAKVKMMEPDGYGAHASVQEIVGHLQAGARQSDDRKSAIDKELEKRNIDKSKLFENPDYAEQVRDELVMVDQSIREQYGDPQDQISDKQFKGEKGTPEHSAHFSQVVNSNAAKLKHASTPEAAAKYLERIRIAAHQLGIDIDVATISDGDLKAMVDAKTASNPDEAVESTLKSWGKWTGKKDMSIDALREAWLQEQPGVTEPEVRAMIAAKSAKGRDKAVEAVLISWGARKGKKDMSIDDLQQAWMQELQNEGLQISIESSTKSAFDYEHASQEVDTGMEDESGDFSFPEMTSEYEE